MTGPGFDIGTSGPVLKRVSDFSISSSVKGKKKKTHVDVVMDIF